MVSNLSPTPLLPRQSTRAQVAANLLRPTAEETAVIAHRLLYVVVIVLHTHHVRDHDMLVPAHLCLSRGKEIEMLDTTDGGETILEIDVGHRLHLGGMIRIGMNHPI
jgi:hypothetical protein